MKKHNITEPHILAPVSGHMSQCDHISWSKQRKVNIKLIQHVNMLQLLLITLPRNSKSLTMRPILFRLFLTFRHPDMKSGPAVSFTLSLSSLYVRTPGVGHHLTFIMFNVCLKFVHHKSEFYLSHFIFILCGTQRSQLGITTDKDPSWDMWRHAQHRTTSSDQTSQASASTTWSDQIYHSHESQVNMIKHASMFEHFVALLYWHDFNFLAPKLS